MSKASTADKRYLVRAALLCLPLRRLLLTAGVLAAQLVTTQAHSRTCKRVYLDTPRATTRQVPSEATPSVLQAVASGLAQHSFQQQYRPSQTLVIDPTNFQHPDQRQFLFLGLHFVAETFHQARTFPNPDVIGPFVYSHFDAHLQNSVHIMTLGPQKRYLPEDFQFLPEQFKPRTSFVAPQVTAFFRLAFRKVLRNGNEEQRQLPLENLLNKSIFDEPQFREFTQVVELGRGAIDGGNDISSIQQYTNTFTKLFNVLSPVHLDKTLVTGLTLEPRIRDYFVREWGFSVDRTEAIPDGRPGYLIVARASDLRTHLLAKQKDPSVLQQLTDRERTLIETERRNLQQGSALRDKLKNKVLFRVFYPERISETMFFGQMKSIYSEPHPNPRPDSSIYDTVEIVMMANGERMAQVDGRTYPLQSFSARITEIRDETYSSAVSLRFSFRRNDGHLFQFDGQIPLFTGQIQFKKSITGMLDKGAISPAYNLDPIRPTPEAAGDPYSRPNRSRHYFTSTDGHQHGSLDLRNLYTIVGNVQLQKADIGPELQPATFSSYESGSEDARLLYRETKSKWAIPVREVPLYDHSGSTVDWRDTLRFTRQHESDFIAEIPAETLFMRGTPEPSDFFTMSDPTQSNQVMTMNSHASVQIFPLWQSYQYAIPVRDFIQTINESSR